MVATADHRCRSRPNSGRTPWPSPRGADENAGRFQSEGLEPGGIGYRRGMKILVIVVIVAIVVAIAAVLMKRRANQKAVELRNQAQEHRDEAKASQSAATRQETQANAMAAKAKDDLLLAEQQRSAAAVKREVAADLNVRADNIDPDVPNTRT